MKKAHWDYFAWGVVMGMILTIVLDWFFTW